MPSSSPVEAGTRFLQHPYVVRYYIYVITTILHHTFKKVKIHSETSTTVHSVTPNMIFSYPTQSLYLSKLIMNLTQGADLGKLVLLILGN